MINIQTIQNVTDCTPLYLPHSLYLKPTARLNISVMLPNNKTGKSISNLDIMEKLSTALKPDKFLMIKVSKSTVDFIRFEGELDDRSHLRGAIRRLDGITLKLSGFSESFRVRASEPKDEFPTRHDWDSFFRDASHMDEMKAGERPDTVHLTHLPIRWFCPRHSEQDDGVKPSESIFRRIFEKFGCIRSVDIPICDPYRNKMNADINGMKAFTFEQEVLFEAYVQFDEYVGFVRTMDAFRGMKLVRKFVDKTQAVNIVVTFDKTKHLSDAQSQRRERVRKRLISKAQAEEEGRIRQKQLQQEKMECERQKEEQLKQDELEKLREREEKRKEKHMKRIQERGQVEISQKIRIEERKLIIAQRKLESIRILEELFDRIKLKQKSKHSSSSRKRQEDSNEESKNDLRNRLVQKYKSATEKLLNEQKQKVHEIKNKTPLSGLLAKVKDQRLSTSSSDEEDHKRGIVKSNGETDSTAAMRATSSSAPVSIVPDGLPLNPFKAVAALAAAGSATAYANEAAAASEWMKSLSMFPYMSTMFPGMSALCRQPNFAMPMNYRGFPRIRARGRGRGRGRGNYDNHSASSSYYNNYKHNQYEEDAYDGGHDGGYHDKSTSYPTSRYRTRSRSRSRKRHYTTRSRTRRSRSTRSWSSRDSRSRSRSRSRTRTKSKSKSHKTSRTPPRSNKKLVSTRRSRTTSSDSRSRSRSRSKRSWSRRSKRRHSNSPRRIVLETDKLVESAEEIKRSIEKDMQQRMRDEEREIKENFRRRKQAPTFTVLTDCSSEMNKTTAVALDDVHSENLSPSIATAAAPDADTNAKNE